MSEVRPPETVALANWLVGPFSYSEQAASELAAWQVPFYEVAVNGLRRIAGIDQNQEFPADFQPDPLKGVELYRELAPDRKVHGMINSLYAYIDDYKSGVIETPLYDLQKDVLEALVDEIADTGMQCQVNGKSPTGSGKTAVLTTFVKAVKYKEQPNDPVRVLVLLPTKDILSQTIKAFRKFTDIEATAYFGEEQTISDVTGMTYQSFKKALERGDINEDSFDVLIRDEADTFSRGKTGTLVDNYCRGSKTRRRKLVLGLTATPHEEQKLAYERSIVEGIRDKQLAPLHTYQRRTRAVVHEDSSDRDWREDFKDSEVVHLMDDEERNGIVVQEVLSGLSSGRRVLVRCIPGDKLRHPRILKDMLAAQGKVRIKHPYVGDVEYRPIRTMIIPGTMTLKHREILTGIFNNPLDERLDVLLFVGTLLRGFDTPAKKVVNSMPSRSPKLVEQLLGRVERWAETMNGNIVPAQAVDIVDSTESGQVTFEDIINRDAPEGMRYQRGAIIGPGLADLRDVNSAPGSAFVPISAEELSQAAEILCTNGLTWFEGSDLRTTSFESVRGRVADSIVGAAALVQTAKSLSMRQLQTTPHVPLANAARALNMSTEALMLTAHRMRVGLEIAGEGAHAKHFFSPKAFARLQARLGDAASS